MADDILIKFKESGLVDLSNKTKELSFKLREFQLKINKTSSAAWVTKYKKMVQALKEQKLQMDKNIHSLRRLGEVEKSKARELIEVSKKITAQNQKRTRQQALVNKMMGGGAQKLVENSKRINALGQQHEGFFKVLRMGQEKWQKFNKEGGEFNKKSSRAANSIRKFSHGLRGFRMEMLGVMFFGMGMSNFFTNLLQPALELTGIFKIWSLVLQMLFLPIAMALLPIMLKVLEMVLGWSDETKLLIGKFVIAGIIIGGFLFLIGMLALGIGAIIMAFSGFFNILSKIFSPLDLIKKGMGSVVAFGTGVGILSKAWEAVSNIFGSLMTKFLELDFVKEALKSLNIEVGNKTPWELLQEAAGKVWDDIKKKIGLTDDELGDKGILGTIKSLIPNFDTIIGKAKGFIKEFKLDEMVKSMGSLADTLNDLIDPLEAIAELAAIISTALGYVVKGKDFVKEVQNKLYYKQREAYEKAGPLGKELMRGGGYTPGNMTSFPLPSAFTQQSNSFNPTTTINANVSSNVDMEQIMSYVNSTNEDAFNRMSRG